jgi:hypothetical protein
MSIYKNRTPHHIYRKIYEEHYGSIPVEADGRTYEIHHIDGDDTNNDPMNLVALTLQDHYDLHYAQGDYQACRLMAMQRMNKTPEEISELNRKSQLKLMEEGRHHFVGDTNPSVVASKNGTHSWINNDEHPMKLASKNGTHHFTGGDIQRALADRLIEQGTHNFVTDHPSKTTVVCPHCGVSGPAPSMGRNHFDNCKTINPTHDLLTCPHCGKTGDRANMKRWHFDKCRHQSSK